MRRFVCFVCKSLYTGSHIHRPRTRTIDIERPKSHDFHSSALIDHALDVVLVLESVGGDVRGSECSCLELLVGGVGAILGNDIAGFGVWGELDRSLLVEPDACDTV